MRGFEGSENTVFGCLLYFIDPRRVPKYIFTNRTLRERGGGGGGGYITVVGFDKPSKNEKQT